MEGCKFADFPYKTEWNEDDEAEKSEPPFVRFTVVHTESILKNNHHTGSNKVNVSSDEANL